MAKHILMLLLLFIPLIALANDYYNQHETGWYWFDDPSNVPANIHNNSNDESKVNDPTTQVSNARQKIKKALDQAIIDPTPQNVENYIILQNQMSERANKFSNAWQEVIHTHPEFNYSLVHPTNNIALQVYNEKYSKEKLDAINDFTQHAGLFFFYRSTCPYCKRFAPIIKHFSEKYHIAVVPITTDGISLPEFPNSRADNGQSKQFQVTVEPALYAVDLKTKKAFPIAFGLTSESELFDNFYNIITHYKSGLS